MKTIYLAGFDVFRKDALAWGEHLKALCARYGFEGLYPLDKAGPRGLSGPAAAQWIYDANVALIRHADIVMANLDDFRGPGEPDSGTAFEVGFAVALQKPVWGYAADAGTLLDRARVSVDDEGEARDAGGYVVENFGLPMNLMLACSVRLVTGDAEACLAAMAEADRRRAARRAQALREGGPED